MRKFKLNNLSDKQILIGIFIISLIIRLGFGIYTFQQTGTSDFCDDWDYISFARNINSQGIFVPDISKLYSNSHLNGPGFPAIIALFFKIFGETYWPIIIFNAILSALIPILIYYLGKICFNKKVGLWAAMWGIFFVSHFYKVHHVLREILNNFIFLSLIILFIKVLNEKKISYKTILLPIVYTFLIHVDERFFTYFPFLALCFLIFNKTGFKSAINKSVIFVSLTIILMLPWLVRNYNVYGRVVILTEMTARFTDQLFGYNDSGYLREDEILKQNAESIHKFTLKTFDYYMDPQESEQKSRLNSLLKDYDINQGGVLGQNSSEKEKVEFAKTEIDSIMVGFKAKPSFFGSSTIYYILGGLKYKLIPHKFSYWERRWVEFKEYFRPFRLTLGYIGDGFRFQVMWSFKHNFSLALTYGILLPFFIIGVYYVFKLKNKYGLILLIMILVHMIIHVFLEHVRNRYRFPTDPFIIIIAFYGAHRLFNIINDFNLRKRI